MHGGGAERMTETASRRLAADDGFTIIEIIVASVVLIVGMLGVLTLMTGALRTTALASERVGATNLARTLVEASRGLDYDDMTSTLVRTRLQAQGLGSGAPWTIARRGVTYTITAASCTFDNPSDKLAATPPAGVCTPQPAGASGDVNGDDFRRTNFQVAWTDDGGAQRSLTQTTLVVNPSGGLGPRTSDIAPVSQTITSNVDVATVVWTTTPARTLNWVVDDGVSFGSVTGTTSFTTSWDIGTPNIAGDSPNVGEILDGSYQITATPFDDRDIAGEAKRANVVLNRRRPYAPPSLDGGHDTRLNDWVDLEWEANEERDVLGYRVWYAGADHAPGNADDERVCPVAAEGTMLDPTVTSCADLEPPSGAGKYYVVALDRDPDTNDLRQGDRRNLHVNAPGPRPASPIGLTVVTVSGQPTLVWIASLLGGASFYRIYRDGTRYDRTSGAALTYTDSDPDGARHEYFVTAVDSDYNESNVIGPVVWLP